MLDQTSMFFAKGEFFMEKQKRIIYAAATVLAVYLGMRYLLRLMAPFFIAWILVKLFNPLAVLIRKKLPLKKEWITLFLLSVFLGSLGAGCYFLIVQLLKQIRQAVSNMDLYIRELNQFFNGCSIIVEQTLGIQAEDTLSFLQKNLANFQESIQIQLIPSLFSNSLHWAAYLFQGAGLLFLVFIAVTLLMRDYDAIREKLSRYRPFIHLSHIVSRIFVLGGAWLKAQAFILLLVTLLCIAGLCLLGNPYALLVGILIGLLDALPFLGTGTVFLPWALICCFQEDFIHAAGYVTIFLVTNTLREYLEPKLLGDKMGVYPIVIALVVYMGLCIYGPAGVLLGPLTLFIIMEIFQEFSLLDFIQEE